jgi:hypothetical protein
MRMHQRFATLAFCLALAPVAAPTSALAATAGPVTSVAEGGRLVLYADDPVAGNELVIPDAGWYEHYVRTEKWVFTFHRKDNNYTIGLPDHDLCWHRDHQPDRTRVKVEACGTARSARWILDPVDDGDRVAVIRPAGRVNEALTIGTASGHRWNHVVLRPYSELGIQHWQVPVEVGGGG